MFFEIICFHETLGLGDSNIRALHKDFPRVIFQIEEEKFQGIFFFVCLVKADEQAGVA